MASRQSSPRQGFWLTAGEVVGALALVIAGLNLWESHQQRVESARRVAGEDQARTAFVAQGHAEDQGRSLVIGPLSAAQAITSQRYLFPSAIQPASEEVSAAQPRIDLAWLAPGLGHSVETRRLRGPGRSRLPVVIETTYVEDGETRSDVSLYDIGYGWKPKFLGGEQIHLLGLALVRRGVRGDERKIADAVWARDVIPDRPR
jgi:hypothetical protein